MAYTPCGQLIILLADNISYLQYDLLIIYPAYYTIYLLYGQLIVWPVVSPGMVDRPIGAGGPVTLAGTGWPLGRWSPTPGVLLR